MCIANDVIGIWLLGLIRCDVANVLCISEL